MYLSTFYKPENNEVYEVNVYDHPNDETYMPIWQIDCKFGCKKWVCDKTIPSCKPSCSRIGKG